MLTFQKFVDLSLPLNASTPIYPGDPEPHFSVATTLEQDGYNLFNVNIGSQSGSHVDAPYHFNNDGGTVDQVALSQCFGNGLVIDVTHKNSMEAIEVIDIEPFAEQISRVDIVLFRTDWDQHIGTEAFFEHPFLSEQGAIYLLQLGIKTVAIDTINLDKTGGTEFPVHTLFAARGGLIAENLCNFRAIDFDNPLISLLPLNLSGCDGSPVRAVAIQCTRQS
ncbi:cyclase family protein [Aestuariicella hydrocarbonica]|uniref:Cyclase family protein n=1 Tax=Pseudomaricurvus hydrocarbonicus TaxID=1470433 RepID=A0A9E5JZ67_9GAMM|nr:cyclase family protein [Aestuariicella hydrocarbonica]NHO65162.1 cyclase family protein [Aestuariicella hydrocarbonica]